MDQLKGSVDLGQVLISTGPPAEFVVPFQVSWSKTASARIRMQTRPGLFTQWQWDSERARDACKTVEAQAPPLCSVLPTEASHRLARIPEVGKETAPRREAPWQKAHMEEGWRIVTMFVTSCIMLRPKEVSRSQSDKQGRELWSACKDLEAA